MYTCTSTDPVSISTWHLKTVLGSFSRPTICSPKEALSTLYNIILQYFLSLQQTSFPYRKFCCLWNLCFYPVELVLQLGLLDQEDAWQRHYRVEVFSSWFTWADIWNHWFMCNHSYLHASLTGFWTGAFSLKPVEDCVHILLTWFFLVFHFLKKIIYLFVVLSHP